MKPEPLVTRALEDAIRFSLERSETAVTAGIWRQRGDEYRRLLAKLKPAKSVPKRGRP